MRHYVFTLNGHKITLFLEETGVPYQLHRLNISVGDQFKPAFLTISPNNKILAIVDNQPADSDAPLSLVESGAILLYLAEKTGQLLSHELRERHTTLQWLLWQMAGFGQMLGQKPPLQPICPGIKYLTPSIATVPKPHGCMACWTSSCRTSARARVLQHRRYRHLSLVGIP